MKSNNRKTKAISLIIALVLVFCLAACGSKGNGSGNKSSLKIEEKDWPIVDGATAFKPFYVKAASVLLGKEESEAVQYVLCSTTDLAYPKLADKEVDLIFCLGPSAEQEAYAKSKGVTFAYQPVLNEAFVFFVNKSNPVDSVTVQQLHDIYAGKITNWKELGADYDEPIIAYQRSEGSGSQTGLYKFVIPSSDVMVPPTGFRLDTMDGIVEAVANYSNSAGALGYSYLYFVKNQHYDDNIKLLKVEGVAPTNEAVSNGKYPMINTAYAVFRSSEPNGSIVRTIAAWCAGEEAAAFAEELGYVVYKAPEGK